LIEFLILLVKAGQREHDKWQSHGSTVPGVNRASGLPVGPASGKLANMEGD
jgi:hypothetical protein